MAYLKVLSWHSHRRTKEKTQKYQPAWLDPGRDENQGPPKYKPEAILLKSTFLVRMSKGNILTILLLTP
jgi:hypothetical protein